VFVVYIGIKILEVINNCPRMHCCI